MCFWGSFSAQQRPRVREPRAGGPSDATTRARPEFGAALRRSVAARRVAGCRGYLFSSCPLLEQRRAAARDVCCIAVLRPQHLLPAQEFRRLVGPCWFCADLVDALFPNLHYPYPWPAPLTMQLLPCACLDLFPLPPSLCPHTLQRASRQPCWHICAVSLFRRALAA